MIPVATPPRICSRFLHRPLERNNVTTPSAEKKKMELFYHTSGIPQSGSEDTCRHQRHSYTRARSYPPRSSRLLHRRLLSAPSHCVFCKTTISPSFFVPWEGEAEGRERHRGRWSKVGTRKGALVVSADATPRDIFIEASWGMASDDESIFRRVF